MKSSIEGKSSTNHIGTAMYLREDKPYKLPPDTLMRSPHGILFKVVSCVQRIDTRFKVTGYVCPEYVMQQGCNFPALYEQHEMHRILTGFLYPEIGWEVLDVPGQSPMPPLTYCHQEVPPPMNGWVKSTATDADIIFGRDRGLCHRSTDDAVSLTSERMFRILCHSNLMTGLRSAAYHLKSKRELAQSAINDNSDVVIDSFS